MLPLFVVSSDNLDLIVSYSVLDCPLSEPAMQDSQLLHVEWRNTIIEDGGV